MSVEDTKLLSTGSLAAKAFDAVVRKLVPGITQRDIAAVIGVAQSQYARALSERSATKVNVDQVIRWIQNWNLANPSKKLEFRWTPSAGAVVCRTRALTIGGPAK